MLAPEVGHLDTRRLPVELGIDQRPVHPVLAVQHELSGGGAHRFQGLRVAVLRGARVDLDQGSGQSCRPVPRVGQSQVRAVDLSLALARARSSWTATKVFTGSFNTFPARGYGYAGEIGQKHAANGSDLKFLRTKFQETFHAFTSSAENITLQNVSGPTSLQHFLTVTLQMSHVNIAGNEAITGATLEPFATLKNTLQFLNVSMSARFGGNLEPPQLAWLVLS